MSLYRAAAGMAARAPAVDLAGESGHLVHGARTTVDTALDDGLSAVSAMLMSEVGNSAPRPDWRFLRANQTVDESGAGFPVLLIVDDAGAAVAGDDSLQSFLRATADADSPKQPRSSWREFRHVQGFNTVMDDAVMRVSAPAFSRRAEEFVRLSRNHASAGGVAADRHGA